MVKNDSGKAQEVDWGADLGKLIGLRISRQSRGEVWEKICAMNECKTHSRKYFGRIYFRELLLHSFIASLRIELVSQPTGPHSAAEEDELARSFLLAATAVVLDDAEAEEWTVLPLPQSPRFTGVEQHQ
jgi:hypothetical protein